MPKKIQVSPKNTQLAIRFFTYGVMTVTTAVLTSLLIMVALGYQFNRSNLSFTQGGLVQLRSMPPDATVTINNQRQNFRTPGKVNLAAGTHNVVMAKDGYRSWSKEFGLEAGQLVWLNYARLIPADIKTNTERQFDAIHAMAASPDRRWLLVQPAPNMPSFVLADYDDRDQPVFTTFTLPDSQLTKHEGAFGSFDVVEWDLDSQFVLVRHQLPNNTIEFIRVDRAHTDEPVNLTREFDLPITQAHFAGNSADIVFAKTDTVLRRLDVGGNNASGALATNVRDFKVYGSGTLAFTQDIERTPGDAATRVQQIALYDGGEVIAIRTVPLDHQVIFDYNEYDDHEYLAIGQAGSSLVEIMRDPAEQTGQPNQDLVFASLDVGRPLRWLSFSGNGRMLVAQNASTIGAYDLEEARAYHRTLDFGGQIDTPLRWLDDYYLWGVVGGQLYVTEFDGTNTSRLGAVNTGPAVMLSADGTRLFNAGQSQDGKTALRAMRLTVTNDD